MTKTTIHSLDGPALLVRKRELEQLLASTRGDPDRAAERAALREEDAAVSARLAEIREETKRENTRRNFAGIGSPLHEALVARLDACLVVELESDALARFAEREKRAVERREKKGNLPTSEPLPTTKISWPRPGETQLEITVVRRATPSANEGVVS